MAQEGDWIYALDEELHERLRTYEAAAPDAPNHIDNIDTQLISIILIAISLSRIALTLQEHLVAPEDLDG